MLMKTRYAMAALSMLPVSSVGIERSGGGSSIPKAGVNRHRPTSASTPVPGGGARERARNLARMQKAAAKEAARVSA